MQGTTKERLTGAIILFAVLAIAVPELLSGPGRGRDARHEQAAAEAGPPVATYELSIEPGSGAGPSQQQLAATTAAPVSEAIAQAVPPPVTEQPTPPAAQRPAPADDIATAQPAARPASSRERETLQPATSASSPRASTPAPAPASGGWWVQLGSFASGDNAQRLARELREKGFGIDVSKVSAGGRELYRVRAGPAADRAAATALRERLAAAGQQGTLIAP